MKAPRRGALLGVLTCLVALALATTTLASAPASLAPRSSSLVPKTRAGFKAETKPLPPVPKVGVTLYY